MLSPHARVPEMLELEVARRGLMISAKSCDKIQSYQQQEAFVKWKLKMRKERSRRTEPLKECTTKFSRPSRFILSSEY